MPIFSAHFQSVPALPCRIPSVLMSSLNYFNSMSVETFRSVPSVLPCRIPSVLVSSLQLRVLSSTSLTPCLLKLSEVFRSCLVELPVFLCPLSTTCLSKLSEVFQSCLVEFPVFLCPLSTMLTPCLLKLSEVFQSCLVEFPVFLCALFNYFNSVSVETFRSVPVLPCRIPSVLVSSLQLL